MPLSRWTCPDCGERTLARRRTTPTGRTVCEPCHDRLVGLAAGVLGGGGDVGEAVSRGAATSTLFDWLRRRRREGGRR